MTAREKFIVAISRLENPVYFYRLKELASEIGFSEVHTSRLFKKIFGVGISEMRRKAYTTMIRRLMNSKTPQEIANIFGVTTTAVYYHVKRLSLKGRHGGNRRTADWHRTHYQRQD